MGKISSPSCGDIIVRSRLDKGIWLTAGAEPKRVVEVEFGLKRFDDGGAQMWRGVICPFPTCAAKTTKTIRVPALPTEIQFTAHPFGHIDNSPPPSAALRAFMRHVKMMVRADPYWKQSRALAIRLRR